MMMSNRLYFMGAGTVAACLVCSAWSAPPATPIKLSDVASADDLVAEVEAKVSEIESGLVSLESFQAAAAKLRLSAVQLTVLSQALAEHDEDSKLKSAAPSMRNAAIQIRVAASFDQARHGLDALHAAMEDKGRETAAVEYDWAKLAQTRLLMESLRERTDLVRKALRRSKDPLAESRHATTMAVLALAVAAHADDVKNPDERPMWRDWSMEFQREMTKTAAALRRKDASAVLQHFTAAQASCDQCHEKFKR
jgi:hypothetical protein